jgi:enediyne biosynthesis protein E4
LPRSSFEILRSSQIKESSSHLRIQKLYLEETARMRSGLSELLLHGLVFAAVSVSVNAQAPPLITKQPVSLSISLGATATFNVTASAVPAPSYQWQRNAQNVPAATNRTFQLLNAQLAYAGSYRVIVSNELGSVTSVPVELDVDPTFTEIALPLFNIAGGSSGASWSDVNNDGMLDLLIIAKAQGGTILLTNRGDGSFGKSLNSGIPISGLGGGPFADIDNDGDVDLFVSGANGFYRNTGAGKFVALTPAPAVSGTYTAAWADYDNDGFIDLFCGNYYTGGANFLFHNNGLGGFTKVIDLAPARDRSYSQGIAWGDYDNDGLPDLFVSNTSAQKCFLYHNDGPGGFTKITNSPVTTIAGNYACGAWGDYDNDGYLDLFVCGYKERRRLFRNNRDGSFTEALSAGFGAQDIGEDQSASWIDFDNDAHLDLFICGGGLVYGLKDALYRNNGDGTFSRHGRGSLVNDQGEGAAAAWGDFDRDGFPDLFITNFQNTGARSNYLYHASGNSNAWLNIRLTGRISNRSAIGTKIRVLASIAGKPREQLREISGGGAYLAQNSLEAMFGLGDATIIDSVRIEWPSGIVQELRSVAARQFLSFTEPPRIAGATLSLSEFSFRCEGREAGTVLETSVDLKEWVRMTNSTLEGGIYKEAVLSNGLHFFRTLDLHTAPGLPR